MSTLCEKLRVRFYIHQNFPGDDFGVSKMKVMQACSNKLQYFIVRRIGAFAVLEYHHSDTDAFAPIQYIIRSETVRFPQDLTDAGFGAASSVRNRTNLGVLSNDHVHRATRASYFQPHANESISGRCLQQHSGSHSLPARVFTLVVPAVARRPCRLFRLRRLHHGVEQLPDEADRVDLVVVATGGEAEQLRAEVGEPSPFRSTASIAFIGEPETEGNGRRRSPSGQGPDVLVHAEEVFRIVLLFDPLQPPVVGAIRGGDSISCLVVVKIVHIPA
jgi:hypothetical protein